MKLTTTLFARAVVILVTLAALSVCFILLPELAREEMVGKPKNADITLPFLATAYVLASPFFIALYQSFKLLQLIDRKKAFSEESIKVLRSIKICAAVFSVMVFITFIGGGLLLRYMNPTEDAPPFFMFGFILTFISIVFAVFVAVLQKLLTDAVALKLENDLII